MIITISKDDKRKMTRKTHKMARLGFFESSFDCSVITIEAITDIMFRIKVISHRSCAALLIASQLRSAFLPIRHYELTLVRFFSR